jgi:hypothetical protein
MENVRISDPRIHQLQVQQQGRSASPYGGPRWDDGASVHSFSRDDRGVPPRGASLRGRYEGGNADAGDMTGGEGMNVGMGMVSDLARYILGVWLNNNHSTNKTSKILILQIMKLLSIPTEDFTIPQ